MLLNIMPNTCPLIITRGKNKGKACGYVNKKCRHKNIKCPHCGIIFTVETSYIRHQTICDDKISRLKLKCCSTLSHPDPNNKSNSRKERIKITIKHMHVESGPDNNILLEKIEKLQRELDEVKKQPAVHHHWNIVVGMNFFDELVHKMGKGHAIKYLTNIATEGKPLDVISKLYLEGTEPKSYPIACQDHDHFRYIGADHRVIDDKGGHGISKLVSSGVHNALLLAANEAINEQVAKSDYDCYNIAPIQSYVANMRQLFPCDHIVTELSHMTRNPNHPFFTDADAFKIESTLDDS
jgi:hypothetical protein